MGLFDGLDPMALAAIFGGAGGAGGAGATPDLGGLTQDALLKSQIAQQALAGGGQPIVPTPVPTVPITPTPPLDQGSVTASDVINPTEPYMIPGAGQRPTMNPAITSPQVRSLAGVPSVGGGSASTVGARNPSPPEEDVGAALAAPVGPTSVGGAPLGPPPTPGAPGGIGSATDFSSRGRTQTTPEKLGTLAQALKGVTAPPAPVQQKISSPNPPRPTGTIAPGIPQLLALLNARGRLPPLGRG